MDDTQGPSAKRRKLEHASRILARPFSTPFKKEKPTDVKSAEDATTVSPASTVHSTKVDVSIDDQQSALPTDPATSRRIMQLSKQIRAVRSDIDTLERAAAIKETKNDAHLEALIKKWRRVAQDAADELFPSVKERVNSMGGTTAWQQSELSKNSFGVPQSQQAHDSFYEAPCAAKTDQLLTSEATLDHEDVQQESYHMGMMLKSLNIDHELIKYDILTQSWKE